MSSTATRPVKRGVNPNRLTDKQLVFCAEYLADSKMNGASAARAAGYSQPAVAAAKLLTNPLVQKTIGKALDERLQECKLEATQVLKHLAAALYLDPLELFEPVVGSPGVYQIKELEKVPPYVRRCITKFKCKSKTYTDLQGNEVTDSFVEVELMSKDACIALAMKHLGLGGADGGINVNVNLSQNLLVRVLDKIEETNKPLIVDAGFIRQKATGG